MSEARKIPFNNPGWAGNTGEFDLTEAQVRETMTRMAAGVDGQTAGDPAYPPMTADLDSSIPFNAALDLVLHGRSQPNGYTEFILSSRRQAMKTAVSPASA